MSEKWVSAQRTQGLSKPRASAEIFPEDGATEKTRLKNNTIKLPSALSVSFWKSRGAPAADDHDPNPTSSPPTRPLQSFNEVNYRPIVVLMSIKM